MGVQNDFVIKEGVLEKYEGAGGSRREREDSGRSQ